MKKKRISKKKVIIIGIAGASHSGKTTLARNLREQHLFNCPRIGCDSFFCMGIMPKHEIWGRNWECPESISWEHMLDKIEKTVKSVEEGETKRKYHVIILEGFLLYTNKKIADMCDIKFWLESPQEVCCERRVKRQRIPREYYNEMVWPHYEKYRDVQLENAGESLVVFDSHKNTKFQLVQKAWNIVKKKIEEIRLEEKMKNKKK